MTKSDKILTREYLDWHAKLTGLPSILTDKIRSNLYKKYKRETGLEPWQLSECYLLINSKPNKKESNTTALGLQIIIIKVICKISIKFCIFNDKVICQRGYFEQRLYVKIE